MLAITNGSEKWDYAIAMLKIDGQSPSPEMLEMIEKEKKGEMTMEEIKDALYKKYNIKS